MGSFREFVDRNPEEALGCGVMVGCLSVQTVLVAGLAFVLWHFL